MTTYRESFMVPHDLMGLVIGTKGSNINKARDLEGIHRIYNAKYKHSSDYLFTVIGENEDVVRKARNMLQLRQEVFFVPHNLAERVLGRYGQFLEDIMTRSLVHRIRQEDCETGVKLQIIGAPERIEVAMSLLNNKIQEKPRKGPSRNKCVQTLENELSLIYLKAANSENDSDSDDSIIFLHRQRHGSTESKPKSVEVPKFRGGKPKARHNYGQIKVTKREKFQDELERLHSVNFNLPQVNCEPSLKVVPVASHQSDFDLEKERVKGQMKKKEKSFETACGLLKLPKTNATESCLNSYIEQAMQPRAQDIKKVDCPSSQTSLTDEVISPNYTQKELLLDTHLYGSTLGISETEVTVKKVFNGLNGGFNGSVVIKFLIQKHDGICHVSLLQEESTDEFFGSQSVENWFNERNDIFHIYRAGSKIQYVAVFFKDLEICKLYRDRSKRTYCDDESCKHFHVCVKFVKGNCKRRNCHHPHAFNSPHNCRLKKEYGLDDFSDKEIIMLLNWKFPGMCHDYMYLESGCKLKEFTYEENFDTDSDNVYCPFLHYCRQYIYGHCCHGDECEFRHSFTSPHNQWVLQSCHSSNLPEDTLKRNIWVPPKQHGVGRQQNRNGQKFGSKIQDSGPGNDYVLSNLEISGSKFDDNSAYQKNSLESTEKQDSTAKVENNLDKLQSRNSLRALLASYPGKKEKKKIQNESEDMNKKSSKKRRKQKNKSLLNSVSSRDNMKESFQPLKMKTKTQNIQC